MQRTIFDNSLGNEQDDYLRSISIAPFRRHNSTVSFNYFLYKNGSEEIWREYNGKTTKHRSARLLAEFRAMLRTTLA